ncbi:MAG: hypothetical protein U0694_16835 [Anaerolineae bacterium]
MPTEAIAAIVIALVYLGTFIFWVTYYFKRIEPGLLERLGNRLGLKIRRVGRNWKISQQHTWRQGCVVFLLELVATMLLFMMPFWLLLGAVLVFAMLSGQG